MLELKNNDEIGIWQMYLFALKSPLTREKYQSRMGKFFDFVGLDGHTIEEKSLCFVKKSEPEGNQWVFYGNKLILVFVAKVIMVILKVVEFSCPFINAKPFQ